MANAVDDYTKIFTWEIDNVLSLQQPHGEYVESETFTSKGPYGQDGLKWVLHLYPRGEKEAKSKNDVSVFLALLDGNGSKYVRIDWKLAIINEKGMKVNEHVGKSYLYELEDGYMFYWGKLNFISRSNLANPNKNFIVEGHKLILQSEISVKVEKDLQADLMEKTELTKVLKRKLDTKEGEAKKLRSDFDQYKRRSRAEIEKLEKDNSAAIKKFKEDEEGRCLKLKLEYEQRLKRYRENITKLEEDKLAAIEKFQKEEEEKKILQQKYEELSNSMRNNSNLVDENENDDVTVVEEIITID